LVQPEGPSHGLTPGEPPKLSLDRIQQYVWARYVEFRPAPFELDEAEALAFLQAHYQRHPLTEDAESFCDGILAFERHFAEDGARDGEARSLLSTALQALRAYRDQTAPGFTWEVVEDRYQDLLELC
jgi:hypothetical protein